MKQNRSGWKGESRRHSLARKGIKTTTRTQFRSNGKAKKIPKGYLTIWDRDSLIRMAEDNQQYHLKNSDNIAHDLSIAWDDPLYNSKFGKDSWLTPEELIELQEKHPDTMLSAKFYASRKGGVNRRKVKLSNLIIPHNDTLLLQLDIGREVEKEHSDNPMIATQIAIDHLNEDDQYYTVLLNAFPDEHPELLDKLIIPPQTEDGDWDTNSITYQNLFDKWIIKTPEDIQNAPEGQVQIDLFEEHLNNVLENYKKGRLI